MSASKWPRIKWNQANARLANAPFENLFQEQERRMSALQVAINNLTLTSLRDEAAAELAQLHQSVNDARDVIDSASIFISSIYGYENCRTVELCNDWLAKYPAALKRVVQCDCNFCRDRRARISDSPAPEKGVTG